MPDLLNPWEKTFLVVALVQYRQGLARQRAKVPAESALYQAYSRDLASLDQLKEKIDATPSPQAS